MQDEKTKREREEEGRGYNDAGEERRRVVKRRSRATKRCPRERNEIILIYLQGGRGCVTGTRRSVGKETSGGREGGEADRAERSKTAERSDLEVLQLLRVEEKMNR